MSLAVLDCDNHCLAVAKPAGVPTVPDESGDASLLDLARGWVEREFAKPGRAFLGVVHRLDRPVSGVVVFGRTSKGADRLSRAFRAGEAQKTYLGVVHGWPGPDGGRIEQILVKDRAARRVQAVASSPSAESGKLARTDWRVLERFREGGEERALVRLEPATGRPHQLRVALSTLGHPLLGDLKYGARRPLPDRSIALHALRLELPHPVRGEPVRWRTDPPAEPWWGCAVDRTVE